MSEMKRSKLERARRTTGTSKGGISQMKELAKTYDPKGMEDRIYEKWLEKKYFHAEPDKSKKP